MLKRPGFKNKNFLHCLTLTQAARSHVSLSEETLGPTGDYVGGERKNLNQQVHNRYLEKGNVARVRRDLAVVAEQQRV